MVEAVNIVKQYQAAGGRKLWALDGVDLRLEPDRTCALVGESGCGKSTLARLLLRLERPTAGQILFQGRDLWALPAGEVAGFRRAVQMISQDPYSSLNPRMKVGDIVGEPLDVHHLARGAEKKQRVATLLECVGLDPMLATRYPREFSGGQRQRISIARALAVEPRVLVADEPVSALDVSVQAQVLNLLQQIRSERGLSMLFVSHDLRVVRAVSDMVAVMYLGRIVEYAPVAELYSNPRHPYTQMLLDSVPVADPRARPKAPSPQGDPPNPVDRPGGCPFHPRCQKAMETCYHVVPDKHETGDHWVTCHLYS